MDAPIYFRRPSLYAHASWGTTIFQSREREPKGQAASYIGEPGGPVSTSLSEVDTRKEEGQNTVGTSHWARAAILGVGWYSQWMAGSLGRLASVTRVGSNGHPGWPPSSMQPGAPSVIAPSAAVRWTTKVTLLTAWSFKLRAVSRVTLIISYYTLRRLKLATILTPPFCPSPPVQRMITGLFDDFRYT